MMRLGSLLLCAGLAARAQMKQPSEAWKRDFPAAERLAYGSDNPAMQFGELRLPAQGPGPFPVVILVHGGC